MDMHEIYLAKLDEECPYCLFKICRCNICDFNSEYGKDKLERVSGGKVEQDEAIEHFTDNIREDF